MAFETSINSEALALLLHVAEIVALESCGMAAANNDPEADCRKEMPDSSDDWCLSCAAKQALEEYSAEQ